ncbi:hypothetical protein B0T25DRAFT_586185 [Lasiosphaeria hispida]|uniref:Uncharacterized protein n=1 Tax=Lasiosphaeria hispida TaxID=260671 RepID=A0AAJ0M986_9PEZI|nr:hypothetical protein B0T25DRAFT_586185 [Lasiosphaeria hispida]
MKNDIKPPHRFHSHHLTLHHPPPLSSYTMPLLDSLGTRITTFAKKANYAATIGAELVATGTGTALHTMRCLYEDDVLGRMAVDRLVTLTCGFYDMTHPGPASHRQLVRYYYHYYRERRGGAQAGEEPLGEWVMLPAPDPEAGRAIHEIDLLFTPTCAGVFPDAEGLGGDGVWVGRDEMAEGRIQRTLDRLRAEFTCGEEERRASEGEGDSEEDGGDEGKGEVSGGAGIERDHGKNQMMRVDLGSRAVGRSSYGQNSKITGD